MLLSTLKSDIPSSREGDGPICLTRRKGETESADRNWNIISFSIVFSTDRKRAPNNKDIFNMGYVEQCKMSFNLPKLIKGVAECGNCPTHGHNINYFI
jgi:hypothetical protein